MHAESWVPYQRASFVTPAFPGYFSGHSTFSRSAAEVLTAITGSPYFPGGMGSYSNYVLGFENGPSVPITLQWATYYDAADQAGISRIWGGIHPPIDNLAGRRAGAQCGQGVWALAQKYFDGSVLNTPTTLAARPLGGGNNEIRCPTLRGLYYRLQSTTDLSLPFTNEPGGASALTDIDHYPEAWVPKITGSAAYREHGLLEIVFDEAANSETEACCEEMPGPGSPMPGITGPGGGRIGAVLLSQFIKPGTMSVTPYNHYSSLASWESLLGLPRLADAATVPSVFGADVFSAGK